MDVSPLSTINSLLLVFAGLTAYSVVSRIINRRNSDVHRLCKPKGAHWLWGHEKLVWASIESRYQVQVTRELGHAVALKGALFHPDILLITDPKAIRHINTTRCYDYPKSNVTRPKAERWLGRGLVWAEGAQHKKQRQMLSSVFTHERMRASTDEVRAAANTMVDKLHDYIAAAGTGERTVDVLSWCGRATMDVIGSVGFGHDFQSGDSLEARTINQIWQGLIISGMGLPGFIAPLLMRLFPSLLNLPVKAMKTQEAIKHIVKGIALQIVRNREASQEKPGKDLLSTLLKMKSADVDLDHMLDQANTFLLAGHETTRNTLGFTCWELARNPKVQTRLRQEVQGFQGSGPAGEPTYDELQSKLPYLDAVCKEALRMWPAGAHLERMASRDDTLPLRFPVKTSNGQMIDSIRVKEGQAFFISTVAINRDPVVWGEDSDRFDPERWLDPNRLPQSDATTAGFAGLYTFIEGPRMCIGYRLAIFEYKVILSALVKQFRFIDTGAVIETRATMTFQPYVAGHRDDGPQIPLRVELIYA